MQDDFVKTTNSVYKVLGFLPEGDPLKNMAKEKALAILNNVALVRKTEKKGFLGEALDQLLADIEALEGYFVVIKGQGWVDDINFLIIRKEYQKVKEEVVLLKGFTKVKEVTSVAVKNTPKPEPVKKINPKPSVSEKKSVAKKEVKTEVAVSPKASARHEKILTILLRKKRAQVADLIKELPDVTKRTIRRDLDELMKEGRIVRAGAWNQIFYQMS
jgi:hypothetical protein